MRCVVCVLQCPHCVAGTVILLSYNVCCVVCVLQCSHCVVGITNAYGVIFVMAKSALNFPHLVTNACGISGFIVYVWDSAVFGSQAAHISSPGFIRTTVHMRDQSNEKPYSCSQCSKFFAQSCNLGRHSRVIHR